MKNMSSVHLIAIKCHKIQLQNYQKYTFFFDIPSEYLFSVEKLASEKMHRILLKNEMKQCSGRGMCHHHGNACIRSSTGLLAS